MECNVSEMVKRGHDQAAELKSSCGAVDVRDVAQLISDLAAQLDVQLARSNALAAENAGLKDEISNITFMRDDDFFGSTQRAQEVMGRLVNVKTPATDAFLDEVRAQGVEMAAQSEQFSTWVQQGLRSFAIGVRQGDEFVSELRKGVQS